jgi:hypothetical protein
MDTINVASWNLENLFDTDDDRISQDFEFTAARSQASRQLSQSLLIGCSCARHQPRVLAGSAAA